MRASNYRKKLDKKTWRIMIGSAAAVLLCSVIFFFVYFKVDQVEIQESSHYTAEEIESMVLRGPLSSNSVLAPMLYTTEVEDVPFVEGFEVSQVNRNTILVSVKEKQPVGCIKFLDCYFYFDRSGKIIESSVELDRKVPYFDGLEVDSVVMDEELAIKDTVLNTAVSLVRIFEKNDMIPDHIVFDDQYEITLEYGDIAVRMGKDQYLEEKMGCLIAALPSLTGEKGILHMEAVTSTAKTFNFEREEEEETEEKETEGTEEGGEADAGTGAASQDWTPNSGSYGYDSGTGIYGSDDGTGTYGYDSGSGTYDYGTGTYGYDDGTGIYDYGTGTYGYDSGSGIYDYGTGTYGYDDGTGTYGYGAGGGTYDYGTGTYDYGYGTGGQSWYGDYSGGQWGY